MMIDEEIATFNMNRGVKAEKLAQEQALRDAKNRKDKHDRESNLAGQQLPDGNGGRKGGFPKGKGKGKNSSLPLKDRLCWWYHFHPTSCNKGKECEMIHDMQRK